MTIAGAIITVRANLWQSGPPRVPRIALGAMAVAYAGIVLWVLPALEQRKVVPDVARWVAAHASAEDRIATYRLNRWNPTFRFYVDRHTMPLETAVEARAGGFEHRGDCKGRRMHHVSKMRGVPFAAPATRRRYAVRFYS